MIFTFIFFVNVSYRKERSFLFKRFLYVSKEKAYFRASFVPLFFNFCCVSKIQRFMKVCHHDMLVSRSHCVTRNRISRGNFSLYNDIPLSFPSLSTYEHFSPQLYTGFYYEWKFYDTCENVLRTMVACDICTMKLVSFPKWKL